MRAVLHTVGETASYIARCNKIGVTEKDREGIVAQVAADPSDGVVIRESGGVRKIRYAGSGGYRVLVAYFGQSAPAYLLSILDKGQKANFTDAQIKVMRKLTKDIKTNLSKKIHL